VPHDPGMIRRRLELRGQVQGVGFRPYVYRLATRRGLHGYVANNSLGAIIEIEGPPSDLDAFERDLVGGLPPLAHISALSSGEIPAAGTTGFYIRPSESDATQRPEVTPDAATCTDCRRELFDPGDRRHGYAFINCTNCGPRYSIIRAVPYDRPQTTMAAFTMCPACDREYCDPADRRFHAQPNACPICGPQLRLEPSTGPAASNAVQAAARLLSEGAIVAIKGIGGYHLACRADRQDVVERLRTRKLRDGKPLALMVADVAVARRLCRLSDADEAALTSPAAPIVLARQTKQHGIAPAVAPGCADFGVMLPYAPLHHLLFATGLGPLMMTSANLSGQPLTYRDDDARATLADVADAFLIHDREIFRPIDDSVVFTFCGETIPIRRARGYAPRPIPLALSRTAASAGDRPILAVGGELKATVCLLARDEAILSEHLGDLTNAEAFRHYLTAIERLQQLSGVQPEVVACDLHPQYLSTGYARRLGRPVVAIQHHHAHIASVMAEWGTVGPVVGLACDGTGYGTDGAVWGCELLLCERARFERLGHLAYFPLVGGDAAALEPWRPAAALLRATYGTEWRAVWDALNARGLLPGEHLPTAEQLHVFEQQLARGVNAPPTSSLGRLFDAVSFLVGLCDCNRHEAEAAMTLEAAAADEPLGGEGLPIDIIERAGGLEWSPRPLIRGLVEQRQAGVAVAALAARFHEGVARGLADAAGRAAEARGLRQVALSGGCFANRRLLHRVCALLEAHDVRVLYNRQVPSGDGGLALGQAFVAAVGCSDGALSRVRTQAK
jgi:hydrogenase maturation protein HypF